MKLKRPLVRVMIAAVAIAVASFPNVYQTWKRRQLERLQAESTLIETALGPVEYRKRGEGPVVLIIHGTPGGYDQAYTLSRLIDSENFTFIALSRPGYLRTPLGIATTPEAQADLYAALLDALGIEQAAVIGISGGGPSSIQFALRHPERCSRLAIISGVAQRYSEPELRKDWSPVRLFFARIYNRAASFDPFLALLASLARLRPDQLISEELMRSLTMYHLREVGYVNDMEQFAVIPNYPLELIQAPTFVVHGQADDEVPFDNAELLLRKVPNAKLLAIRGGNHLAFYLHAATVMPALRTFLAPCPQD